MKLIFQSSVVIAIGSMTWLACPAHSQLQTPTQLASINEGLPYNGQVIQGTLPGTATPAVNLQFSPSEWPSVMFKNATPQDWSNQALTFELFNPGNAKVDFGVRVDDDVTADGNSHCQTSTASIAPGEKVTFSLPFGSDPMSLGVRRHLGVDGLPPNARPLTEDWRAGTFHSAHVVAWQIFLHSPASSVQLWLQQPVLHPVKATVADIAQDPNGISDLADAMPYESRATLALLPGATTKDEAAEITFAPSQWPGISFHPETPQDWTGKALVLDLTNPGADSVEFNLRVDDDKGADGTRHTRKGAAILAPGEHGQFALYFGTDPSKLGMFRLPPVVLPGTAARPIVESSAPGPFNSAHIVAWQIFLQGPKKPTTLWLQQPKLVAVENPLNGIVDPYGQYVKADWPGKLKDATELKTRRATEDRQFQSAPTLPDRDEFGGWSAGPKLKATGFFRTEKVNNRWWFVDPAGHPFFSNGIDTITQATATTITGRENMFTWLPKAGDPLNAFAGQAKADNGGIKGESFDFYRANLSRKYGPAADADWAQNTLKRLRAWGFNTVGNWSDKSVTSGSTGPRVPYVVAAGVGGKYALVPGGGGYWNAMPDPYDPQFAASAATFLGQAAQGVKDDPYCLGYFVDNELSWGDGDNPYGRYGLAYGALSLSVATSPAKAAFVKRLTDRYKDIAAFNTAWGANFASWDELSKPFKPQATPKGALLEDLAAFTKAYALQYFKTVRDALRAADPNHLYLGCRFAGSTPEAAQAAAQICDVVSYNVYRPALGDGTWKYVAQMDKPCLVGEFHFGATDRGSFHPGLVPAKNQADRAAMYQTFVQSVLANPNFVGCHWFQYVDQPITGRPQDGENFGIGFVDVTDTPYPELVAAAKVVNQSIYTIPTK